MGQNFPQEFLDGGLETPQKWLKIWASMAIFSYFEKAGGAHFLWENFMVLIKIPVQLVCMCRMRCSEKYSQKAPYRQATNLLYFSDAVAFQFLPL